MNRLVLRNQQAPGDVLMLTAAVRELQTQFPGLYEVRPETTNRDHIWANNPYITLTRDADDLGINMVYGAEYRNSAATKRHFLSAFVRQLNQRLNLDLKLTQLKPDVHLTEQEKSEPPVEGPYWVVLSGGKLDMPAKWWDPARWQGVVDKLRGEIAFVQAGGGPQLRRPDHAHPKLDGVLDFVGRTNLRDFIRLIYHSQGVCCCITAAMHLSAAFNKPCVVVAGGRESYTWEAYTHETWELNTGHRGPDDLVEHRFLHTIGQLGCCSEGGCRKKTVNAPRRSKNCMNTIDTSAGLTIPRCLGMIAVDDVVDAVRSYRTPAAALKDVRILEENLTMSPPSLRTRRQTDGLGYLGKATVCVLLYGEFKDLHRRVVAGIVRNTKVDRYRLIVGCNEVCQPTLDWLAPYLTEHSVDHTTLVESGNIYKYPFMRRMFALVDTPWVIWFDDDSHVTIDGWLPRLAEIVHYAHPKGAHCFGRKYYYNLKPGQEEWIQQASWYRGKPLQRRHGRKRVTFATGGFWALSMEAVRALDWPDPRIRHNGGDTMLGEALRQNGMDIKQVDIPGLRISDAPRRGCRETHAGVGA